MIKLTKNQFVRIEVLILLFLIISIPITYYLVDYNKGTVVEFVKEENYYRIYVEASQWNYRVYDLNSIDMEPNKLRNLNYDIKVQFQHDAQHSRFRIDSNSNVTIYLVSRDVEHGLRFDLINFVITANKAVHPHEFGPISSGSFISPSEVTKLEGYNHLPAGLLTDEMQFILEVGNASLLPTIFLSSILGLITAIFVYYTNQFYVSSQQNHEDQ